MILWAADNYDFEEFADVDKFIDLSLSTESEGYSNFESAVFDSFENLYLSFKYLFGEVESPKEIFNNNRVKVLDLTDRKQHVSSFEELENWYQGWILKSNMENSMDEFGQFVGLISYVERNQQKKYLLALVTELEW
jgi:hypothetical protein